MLRGQNNGVGLQGCKNVGIEALEGERDKDRQTERVKEARN